MILSPKFREDLFGWDRLLLTLQIGLVSPIRFSSPRAFNLLGVCSSPLINALKQVYDQTGAIPHREGKRSIFNGFGGRSHDYLGRTLNTASTLTLRPC